MAQRLIVEDYCVTRDRLTAKSTIPGCALNPLVLPEAEEVPSTWVLWVVQAEPVEAAGEKDPDIQVRRWQVAVGWPLNSTSIQACLFAAVGIRVMSDPRLSCAIP